MRGSEIYLETKKNNGVRIININGQLDALTTPALKSEIKKLMDTNCYRLIVNMENVEFLSCTAIGLMLVAALHLRNRNGDLRLCNLSNDKRKLFDSLGVSRLLTIYETDKEAIESFS